MRLHRVIRDSSFPPGLASGRVSWRGVRVFHAMPQAVGRPGWHRWSGRPDRLGPVMVQARVIRRGPHPPNWVEFAQTYQQGFRVADDALAVYELYVGEDAAPDFEASDQPVATSATLPFSWTPTPPPSGTKTLHIVVRQRNAYDLVSFNVFELLKVINALGGEELGPVSIPTNVEVYDDLLGYLRVTARYLAAADADPADTWEVYVGIGSDPVPGVDTPAYSGAMFMIGERAYCNQVVGPYAPADEAHVIVTALRSADDTRSSAAAETHTLAESLELDGADLFGG